ncbi:granzyme A-like [Protopterus annectens]|uniref:granzyme A-like n=1 Tax=Protopterus annectens TaxID=7888 RepID=UPI001CF9DDEA|nr:granzyme A-like [Protopterus annectens]
MKVTLGAHSIKIQEKTQQKINVKKSYLHPFFDNKTPANDIMLLELESAAKLNRFVSVHKLPKSYEDVKAKTNCSVSGWGITDNTKRKSSDVLREVNVTIIDRRICKGSKYWGLLITMDMLCAGDADGKKDSCEGDSGGPLICKGELKGIASFGDKNCGDPQKPGVYTRLSEDYILWIRNITKQAEY